MEHYKIILSVTLLLFVFFSKLLVGRVVGKAEWIQSCLELPISLFSLSISLLLAFTITSNDEKNTGLIYCIIFLTITLPLIFSWRTCQKRYDSGKRLWILLLFINLSTAIIGLYFSGSLFVSKELKEKAQVKDVKKDTSNVK
jgi:predicted permease